MNEAESMTIIRTTLLIHAQRTIKNSVSKKTRRLKIEQIERNKTEIGVNSATDIGPAPAKFSQISLKKEQSEI